MTIRDGKIIVYPSARLIVELYAEGMDLKHIQQMFGINQYEFHKLLYANFKLDEIKEIIKRRKSYEKNIRSFNKGNSKKNNLH